MKIKIIDARNIFFFIFSLGLILSFNSCSSVDYLSYSNHIQGSKPLNKRQINLITYNIKAIYEKEQDQIDKLMELINEGDYDFVIFQELFNESTRDYIIEKADTARFAAIIARVDYNSFPEFIFQDAGLFMMSSYPRVDLTNIKFGKGIKNSNGVIHMILEKELSKTNDFLANKSVLGALFDLYDTTKLFLFTTHVQAIGSTEIKEKQLNQIKNFIEDAVNGILQSGMVTAPENLIVLLAGDFNSNAYDKQRFASMQNILGYPRDLHMEYHGEKEEYTFRFSSRSASRRFDYIMAYDSIGSSKLKKISVESISTVDVKDEQNNSISDHLGLQAILTIK